MTTQQVIQLIVFALIVGGSVIGWIAKQVQEQSAKRRVEAELERRTREMLRTGRPAEEPDPQSSVVADRRREMLEELRRRQASARHAEAQQRRTATQGQVVVQGPTGPIVLQRAGTQQRPGVAGPQRRAPSAPVPQRARVPAPSPARGQAPPTARAPSAPARRAPQPQQRAAQAARRPKPPEQIAEAPALQVVRSVTAAKRAAAPVAPRGGWRQAIIWREILDRPLAERDPLDPT